MPSPPQRAISSSNPVDFTPDINSGYTPYDLEETARAVSLQL